MAGTSRQRPPGRRDPGTQRPQGASAQVRPFGKRVDPEAPGQVGRRPPNPVVPILTGVMWIVVGIVMMATFTASWRFVVGAVCIGIGGLFLRGGLASFIRQNK